jgi:hypothetical protein
MFSTSDQLRRIRYGQSRDDPAEYDTGRYCPSFFSGSFGSAFSMGLRGSIWSRMAAS